MARTGAVVTGSQVIRFFDCQPPNPHSDLDVITQVSGVLDLCLFLETNRYSCLYRKNGPKNGRGKPDDYPMLTSAFMLASSFQFLSGGGRTGIVEIIDFVKLRPSADWVGAEVSHKVQLIVVLQTPIEHIVFGFHSSEFSERIASSHES